MTQAASAACRILGPSDVIGDDLVVPFYLDDRRLRIAITRIDGRLYAFDDLCTCADERCPLSGGLLTGATLMCQCHGSRYDVASGRALSGPATTALTSYPVQEVDGQVQVFI